MAQTCSPQARSLLTVLSTCMWCVLLRDRFHYYRNHSGLSKSSEALRNGMIPTCRHHHNPRHARQSLCVHQDLDHFAPLMLPRLTVLLIASFVVSTVPSRQTGTATVVLDYAAAGTQHGLAKMPYLRDTRRSIGLDDFRLQCVRFNLFTWHLTCSRCRNCVPEVTGSWLRHLAREVTIRKCFDSSCRIRCAGMSRWRTWQTAPAVTVCGSLTQWRLDRTCCYCCLCNQ